MSFAAPRVFSLRVRGGDGFWRIARRGLTFLEAAALARASAVPAAVFSAMGTRVCLTEVP
jgi:hypothetical protein